MAYTSREIEAGAIEAFAVLIDPETYPRWLVGAQTIRRVDPAWPKPGSKFHHVVGVGPLRLADSSEVLEIDESAMMLRLEVRARPLIAAVATFRVIGTNSRCVITLQEEPSLRTIGNLVRPVMDPATHVRNHRSLRRLAVVIEQRDGDLSQRPRRSPEGQG
ncbi:MAG TPA: SRPBCC family protein [Desertimonas sp.]|nr:SRPBCC family protein [Desertimonas sp.]